MISIRDAAAADGTALQSLYDYHKNEDEIIGLTYHDADWSVYLGHPHVFLRVAVKDDTVVGFLHGYDMVDWGYIETLIVSKEVRNLGAGRMLLAAFETWGSKSWVASELCTSLTDTKINDYVGRQGYEDYGKSYWRVKYLVDDPKQR